MAPLEGQRGTGKRPPPPALVGGGALDAGLTPAEEGSPLPTPCSSPTKASSGSSPSAAALHGGGAERQPMPRYRLEDFQTVGSPLGGGSFGQVTKCVHKATAAVYAMKTIPKKKIVEHHMTDYLAREVKTQIRLKHPNILTLYYYFEDADNVHLLLEFAKGGSLFSVLRRRGRLPDPEAARYFQDVALALDHLHSKGVVHRDLKPENILMCDGDVAKLADFGWCAELDKDGAPRHTFCGTWDYLSPEMVQNEPHDSTVDIWAIGVLLYEMLTSRAPFAAGSQMKTLMRITSVDVQYPDYVSAHARDLMEKLLVKEKSDRLPLKEAVAHQWISSTLLEVRRHNRRSKTEGATLNLIAAAAAASKAATDSLTLLGSDDKVVAGAKEVQGKGVSINEEATIRIDHDTSASYESERTVIVESESNVVMGHMTTDDFRRARDKAQAESDGKCPVCGNIFLPDERFCRKCGNARPQPKVLRAKSMPLDKLVDVAATTSESSEKGRAGARLARRISDWHITSAEMRQSTASNGSEKRSTISTSKTAPSLHANHFHTDTEKRPSFDPPERTTMSIDDTRGHEDRLSQTWDSSRTPPTVTIKSPPGTCDVVPQRSDSSNGNWKEGLRPAVLDVPSRRKCADSGAASKEELDILSNASTSPAASPMIGASPGGKAFRVLRERLANRQRQLEEERFIHENGTLDCTLRVKKVSKSPRPSKSSTAYTPNIDVDDSPCSFPSSKATSPGGKDGPSLLDNGLVESTGARNQDMGSLKAMRQRVRHSGMGSGTVASSSVGSGTMVGTHASVATLELDETRPILPQDVIQSVQAEQAARAQVQALMRQDVPTISTLQTVASPDENSPSPSPRGELQLAGEPCSPDSGPGCPGWHIDTVYAVPQLDCGGSDKIQLFQDGKDQIGSTAWSDSSTQSTSSSHNNRMNAQGSRRLSWSREPQSGF